MTRSRSAENTSRVQVVSSVVAFPECNSECETYFPDHKLRPGHILTRVRAISARVNKNFDGFPSEELRESYKTFVGRPVFVNHVNHDTRRARGRVVGAIYHSHGDDRFIECYQDVDGKAFPKLAQALVAGDIDAVSMGTNVSSTECSICGKVTGDELDFCDHISKYKGLHITDPITNEAKLSYEKCRGLNFFELSYVFDPADETALLQEVRVGSVKKAEEEVTSPAPVDTLRDETPCPVCGNEDFDGTHCDFCEYDAPIEGLQEPDLDKAKEVDLHEEEEESGGSEVSPAPSIKPQEEEQVPRRSSALDRALRNRRRAQALGQMKVSRQKEADSDYFCFNAVCDDFMKSFSDKGEGDSCPTCGETLKKGSDEKDTDIYNTDYAKVQSRRKKVIMQKRAGWDPTCPSCGQKFPTSGDPNDENQGLDKYETPEGWLKCPNCGTVSDIDGESGTELHFSKRKSNKQRGANMSLANRSARRHRRAGEEDTNDGWVDDDSGSAKVDPSIPNSSDNEAAQPDETIDVTNLDDSDMVEDDSQYDATQYDNQGGGESAEEKPESDWLKTTSKVRRGSRIILVKNIKTATKVFKKGSVLTVEGVQKQGKKVWVACAGHEEAVFAPNEFRLARTRKSADEDEFEELNEDSPVDNTSGDSDASEIPAPSDSEAAEPEESTDVEEEVTEEEKTSRRKKSLNWESDGPDDYVASEGGKSLHIMDDGNDLFRWTLSEEDTIVDEGAASSLGEAKSQAGEALRSPANEASVKRSRVIKADAIDAMQLADAYVEHGLIQSNERYKTARSFEKLSKEIVDDRLTLLDKVAKVSNTKSETRTSRVADNEGRARRMPRLGQPARRVASDDAAMDTLLFLH